MKRKLIILKLLVLLVFVGVSQIKLTEVTTGKTETPDLIQQVERSLNDSYQWMCW